MRINPHYVQKEEIDYFHGRPKADVIGIDIRRPALQPYSKKKPPSGMPPNGMPSNGTPPIIKLGRPREFELQKKELIRDIVVDPVRRKEAMKAAELEKKSGVKEKPITTALIKTTKAHESAMSATSVEESQAIAEAAAEEVVKEDKKITFNKLFKNSTVTTPVFTLIIGVLLTVVVLKYLVKS